MSATNGDNDWPRMRIGDFAKTCSGATPSRGNESYFEGSIPWVKTGELHDGEIHESEEHVSSLALKETSLKLLPAGTLLVAMYGQGKTRGRTGLLMQPATTNQACFAILPDPDRFDNRYLQLWFRHNYRRLREETDSRGGNQPNLNGVFLRQQEVEIPSLAEQKRIAGILKEQLAAVERARAAAEDQLEAAKALPAAYLRGVFHELDEKLDNRRPVGDVCQLLPSKSIATAGDAEVRAITTACLTESGFDPSGIKTARMWSSDAEACVVAPQEVLIARSNTTELVGRVAMFPGEPSGTVASDLTIRIWAGEAIEPQFLATYLSFLYVTGYWRERAGGASGSMKKITRSQINSLHIPVPHINEQRAINRDIGIKMQQVRELEHLLRSEVQTIEAIPASMLREAFQGRL